jgi:hypothetical protein
MSTMTKRTTFLTVRVDPALVRRFRAKAERYGGSASVLRELVEAFIEDRLIVHPPKQPKQESLYVPRIED